jgi:hypothetical protein
MLSIVLATLLISSYAAVGVLAFKVILDGPAFQPAKHIFDLRLKYGDKVALAMIKQQPIHWEEPEAFIHVNTFRRVQTRSGYFVEHMTA